MEKETLELVTQAVPLLQPYHYFKDKYALDLLRYVLTDHPQLVRSLRQSRWGFLLQKPTVRCLLATYPGGRQSGLVPALEAYWPTDAYPFVLTWGRWGAPYRARQKERWLQTTRPGWNLVLQLNFDWTHDRTYWRAKQQNGGQTLLYEDSCHPVRFGKQNTLAWARLDLDLDTGELLVEEIQNDWLRDVSNLTPDDVSARCDLDAYRAALRPYEKLWAEATLAAVLALARTELGVRRVYYHTFEGGLRWKHLVALGGIPHGAPPRSLYTQLPRRFGFTEVAEAPAFLYREPSLRKTLRRHGPGQWFRLEWPDPKTD